MLDGMKVVLGVLGCLAVLQHVGSRDPGIKAAGLTPVRVLGIDFGQASARMLGKKQADNDAMEGDDFFRLSLRGGHGPPASPWRHPDGREPTFVDLVPKKLEEPTEEQFVNMYGSPEGEDALAKAEEALKEGDLEEAARLHELACDHFTDEGGISAKLDRLYSLEQSIEWAQGNKTADLLRVEEAAKPKPYWSVSQHLNLTKPQVDAIEGWIGRPLDPSRALYVASRDEWTCREFHKRCDGKGATVTIVRTATGHIFGGYAKVPWSKGSLLMRPPRWEEEYVEDKDAFVFRVAAPRKFNSKRWAEVYRKQDEQMLQVFFDRPERQDVLRAIKQGYPEEDVLHYDYIRGKVFIAQTQDGTRNVTSYDKETELAREARDRGELYVTKAQGEDVIANIEEVEAARMQQIKGYREWVEQDQAERDARAEAARKIEAKQNRTREGRWGLDVKVPGIKNATVGEKQELTEWEKSEAENRRVFGYGQEDEEEEPLGGEFVCCRHSGLNLDMPRLRHVWCRGPTWTHALEIDLDNPRNSWSDMLSGALYDMPEGVSSDLERVLLAGKIGGRTTDERELETTVWDVQEVVVISVE